MTNADGRAASLMTAGGDARITLDSETGLNRYFSAPRPRDVIAYASSTANDISPAAYAQVEQVLAEVGEAPSAALYAERLESLRRRIRTAYRLADDVAVVFSPSGTDLEYVALSLVRARGSGGINAVLLGADEVGSGCIHSARGRYFARETALGAHVEPGETVPGLGDPTLDMLDVPVRDGQGRVQKSAAIADRMRASVAAAAAQGRHSLVHVVHGSKTGLILPSLDDVTALEAEFGDAVTFVVDACQARTTSRAIRTHVERGHIVLATGSKFIGAPPFSGFALVPPQLAAAAPPLPQGFATIFRRAEWPAGWPGAEVLPESANIGLLLRLEAAVFELERFQRIPGPALERVILAFHAAVRSEIVDRTGARRVAPYPPGDVHEADSHPVEMRTLSTLDLRDLGAGEASFDDAARWHKALALAGVRLGQPVKCVPLADGRWGATLRIGVSMPQICEAVDLDDAALAAHFEGDMARIRDALLAVADKRSDHVEHQA